MRNTIKIFILTFVLLCSCQQRRQESILSCDFLQNLTPTGKIIEDIPDNEVIKVIKLELTDSSMLGSIRQLELTDSLLFVYDAMNPHVLVFSHDGKFLNQIGNRGEGPQEHINFNLFFLDKENEEVGIIDDYKQVVLYYNYGGKFLRSIPLPENSIRYSSSGILTEGNELLLNNMICNVNNTAFTVVDLSGQKNRKTYFPYNHIKSLHAFYPYSFHPMSKTAEGVSFILPLNDTVYNYTVSGEIKPKYIVGHFKELPRPEDITSNCSNFSSEYFRLWKEGFFTGFRGVFETEDNIVLSFADGILGGYYIGDKKTKSGKYYTEVYNERTKKMPLMDIRNTYRNMFVSSVSPALCDFSSFKNIENPLVQEVLKDYSEDDNPYLFFYKLK